MKTKAGENDNSKVSLALASIVEPIVAFPSFNFFLLSFLTEKGNRIHRDRRCLLLSKVVSSSSAVHPHGQVFFLVTSRNVPLLVLVRE